MSLLFDLPGFRVVSVEVTPLGLRRVVVMQVADEHACPRCGVLAGGKPYDVREMRVKDLPVGTGRNWSSGASAGTGARNPGVRSGCSPSGPSRSRRGIG